MMWFVFVVDDPQTPELSNSHCQSVPGFGNVYVCDLSSVSENSELVLSATNFEDLFVMETEALLKSLENCLVDSSPKVVLDSVVHELLVPRENLTSCPPFEL
jgi:hypothetical protein